MANRIQDKVALITGAASGIGQAAAKLFAQEGATVVVADRDEKLGKQVANEINEANGTACFVQLDVTSEDEWKRVIVNIEKKYGKLNILVNNAGIYLEGPITKTSLTDWRRCMAVNLDSVFLGTKTAVDLLQKSIDSSIVNVASVYGLIGNPGSTALCASKGGVLLFTKAASLELATLPQPIRINAICPGFVETPLWVKEKGSTEIPWEEILANKSAINRPATADEIAKGILFLASDDSSYMTGSELVIDGGYTAR